MASKRTSMASAAEPSLSPKKRMSLGAKDLKDGVKEVKEVKKGKRKIDTDGAEEVAIKVPKQAKSASKATTRRATMTSDVVDHAGSVVSPVIPSFVGEGGEEVAVVKKPRSKRVSTGTALTTGEGKEGKEESLKSEKEKKPRVRKEKVIEAATSSSAAKVPAAAAVDRVDLGKSSLSLKATDGENEIVGLYQQYCGTVEMCLSTVAPLFMVLIFVLYAISSVTQSQTIASIGLVYVFVFLIIISSYVFAIVPFILASNTISNLIQPGKKGNKLVTRVSMLLVVITAVVGYFNYHL